MSTAKGTAQAFDAAAVTVDGEPDETRKRAFGAVEGYKTQIADAQEAVKRAKAQVAKAQDRVAEAKAVLDGTRAEISHLEEQLAAAETFAASLPDE